MIKIIRIQVLNDFQLRLEFSDGSNGWFDGRALLQRTGPLLEALRDPDYFARAFIDAGAYAGPMALNYRQHGFMKNAILNLWVLYLKRYCNFKNAKHIQFVVPACG